MVAFESTLFNRLTVPRLSGRQLGSYNRPIMPEVSEKIITLGVVSYLNARPLIEGLAAEPGVRLIEAVPADLADLLNSGRVDAAMIPVVDLARNGRGSGFESRWERVSDACIGCDGPTLTVRIFSHLPPERIDVLHADTHSHTSVALARLIWRRRYGKRLRVEPVEASNGIGHCPSVLLIGDKVVSAPTREFEYDIDLGSTWKDWTGRPFVFAVWATRAGINREDLADLLNRARDRGMTMAAAIAAAQGPLRGWPVPLAEEYLTRRMKYILTPAAIEGMKRFLDLAAEDGLLLDRREPAA